MTTPTLVNLDDIRKDFPYGSRIEITLREDAEYCGYMTTPFYNNGTSEKPGMKFAGYMCKLEDGSHEKALLLSYGWNPAKNRSAGMGGIKIYEESILSYNK